MGIELAEGVWWLDLRGVNAYLVDDGGDLVLCDAGFPWHADAIRRGVADAGFGLGDIDRVLLTHYDLDHVGGLARLDLDASVFGGADDVAVLRGERSPPLSNHKGLFQRVTGALVSRPDLDLRAVEDGEAVGGFTAYHTPGHSPGHTAFVSDDLGAALLGDLVRSSGDELKAPPWILNYDTGRVRESIRSLAERAPGFGVACPGHGRPLREGGSAALARLVEGGSNASV